MRGIARPDPVRRRLFDAPPAPADDDDDAPVPKPRFPTLRRPSVEFLAPVPRDGACPRRGRKAAPSAGSSPAELGPIANTTVVLRAPSFPPL